MGKERKKKKMKERANPSPNEVYRHFKGREYKIINPLQKERQDITARRKNFEKFQKMIFPCFYIRIAHNISIKGSKKI